MSKGAHTGVVAPIGASLAEFTERLIARRGVEQANVLFGGQIGPGQHEKHDRAERRSMAAILPSKTTANHLSMPIRSGFLLARF